MAGTDNEPCFWKRGWLFTPVRTRWRLLQDTLPKSKLRTSLRRRKVSLVKNKSGSEYHLTLSSSEMPSSFCA